MPETGLERIGGGGTTAKQTMRVFSWPLSKDISAEVRLSGAEEIKPAHLERLRQYLELAKAAVASDEEGNG